MKQEFKAILAEKGRKKLPNVLLAAAECAPLSKTGGLADVVGTLPKSLKALGIEARVITPYHRCIKDKYSDKVEHMFDFYVNLGWRTQYCGIERLELDGVCIYLVDNEFYFGDKIYKGGYEEGEQYAFFTRAVLDAIPNLGFSPDVIHCNDWHTAMLPMLAKTQYGDLYSATKWLLTIHNIAFQGKFGFDYVQDLLGVEDKYYTPEFMELNGCASFLKAGCVFADRINTVSPTYAEEIKTAYFGEGLEGILSARSNELSGIINGIDTKTFNPYTDPAIAANYHKGRLGGKKLCKLKLQELVGLDQRDDVPLFAMVTRMTEQKGFELVECMIDELMMYNDMQFLVLGTGDKSYEDFMRAAEARYKGRLCAYIGYNEELSHKVYAGADFLLMPSRFEPCGLSQMIAMRYGTVPIVRETGGLKDTVRAYEAWSGAGNGFTFANYNAGDMCYVVCQAIDLYHENKEAYARLQQRGMTADFSWTRSAQAYHEIYRTICQ